MRNPPGNRGASFIASSVLCALGCVASFIPRAADAQSIWVNREAGGGFALEYLHPALKSDPDFSLFTGIYVFSVRAPMSKGMQFVGEVPLVNVSEKSVLGDQSSNGVGNVYLGVAVNDPGSGTSFEVGVHAPLADANGALFLGALSDWDRFELYSPNLLTIGARADQRSGGSDGAFTRIRVGPSLHIPTGDFGGDNEISLGYGVIGGFENAATDVALGVTGRWMISGDGSFGETSVNQLTVALSHRFGAIRGGAQLRVPISSDLEDLIKHVIGLNLTIPFK